MSQNPSPQPDPPPSAHRFAEDEVRVTAELARLRLTDEEIARTAVELSRILEYAHALGQVDVSGVQPMTHAVPIDCPLREDELGPPFDVAAALRAAPQRKDDFLVVPAIMGDGDEG